MPFLDETGLEQVLNGIKDNTLPYTEDLVFDNDKKLTTIIMGNVQSNIDENGWVWTETDSYTPVDDNEYANDTSNADYIYEYKPAQIEYSTNEVDTGNKWIDGKPIYRKTYSWSGTGAADVTIGNLPNDLDTVISLGGMSHFPSINRQYTIPNNYFSNTNYDLSAQCNLDTGILLVHCGTSVRVASTMYIIMEYTKTTDIV